MRHLAPSDLTAAARALLPLAPPERPRAMARMIAEAEAADRYRKRAGRAHALWGNGTLEAAARGREIAPQPSLSDTDYLSCLAEVLDALVAHRRRA
jgi:hypothetical protein